jgi:hypothetical protein
VAKIEFTLFVNFLVSAYLKTEGGPPNSDVFILNAFLNVQDNLFTVVAGL